VDALLAECRSGTGTGLTLANSMSATATVLRVMDGSDHSAANAAAMQTSLAHALMRKGILGWGKDSTDSRDQLRHKKAVQAASETVQDQQLPKDQGLVSLLAQMPAAEVREDRSEQVEDNQIGGDLWMPAPCHAEPQPHGSMPAQPSMQAAGGLEAAASVSQPTSQWKGVSFHQGNQK
jgi:hypothetical protein